MFSRLFTSKVLWMPLVQETENYEAQKNQNYRNIIYVKIHSKLSNQLKEPA